MTRTAVFIGDSLIAGNPGTKSWIEPGGPTSPNPEGTISYEFERLTGYKCYNMGYTGNTTEQILTRFINNVIAYSPDICFIEGGVNDVDGNILSSTTIDNIKEMLRLCVVNHIRPVLFLIFPWNNATDTEANNVNSLNTIYQSLITEYQTLTIIDERATVGDLIGDKWVLKSEYNSGDGVHLTPEGYAAIGYLTYITLQNAQLEAFFNIVPSNGNVPLSVNFYNMSKGTYSSTIWDLDGNGNTDRETENVENYRYVAAGNYTVHMTISNEAGSNTITKVISVNRRRNPFPWW